MESSLPTDMFTLVQLSLAADGNFRLFFRASDGRLGYIDEEARPGMRDLLIGRLGTQMRPDPVRTIWLPKDERVEAAYLGGKWNPEWSKE